MPTPPGALRGRNFHSSVEAGAVVVSAETVDKKVLIVGPGSLWHSTCPIMHTLGGDHVSPSTGSIRGVYSQTFEGTDAVGVPQEAPKPEARRSG